MMKKAVGIVCEYNPLHQGHVAQLELVRARFPEHAIVLVMSANYVQRAEAAVCDCYARASAALSAGADLVLSLPFPYCTFGAQGYAESALRLLASLSVVEKIAFGAECEDVKKLESIALFLNSEEFETRLKARLKQEPRAAFAHLRAAVLGELVEGADEILRHPNNILAVEYLSAIRAGAYAIEPVVLHRPALPSATDLRRRLRAGEELAENDAPDFMRAYIKERKTLPQDALGELLLSYLRTGRECAPLSALGERVFEKARAASSFDEFVEQTKTRKFTSARIRRGVLHAYFGVREETCPPIGYSVLLGANDLGREILTIIYNKGSLPIFTKPSAPQKQAGEPGEMARLAARADSVYAGLVGKSGDWFLKQNPQIMNKL